jgi:hypothetical protein
MAESFHTHEDETGRLVKCYHECKSLVTDWKFIVGITVSFPIEHVIWEKLPVFRDISAWLGL